METQSWERLKRGVKMLLAGVSAFSGCGRFDCECVHLDLHNYART